MVIRPQHRRRLAAARDAEAIGDFDAARREIEPIARKGRAASKAMARLALMLGDYEGAATFARDRVTPALLHYRTGRYDLARSRVDLPIVELMRKFGGNPYRLDWDGAPVELPFTQTEPWDLPTVAIDVDGRPVEAWIDTGGDLLTLPHEFGIEPLATFPSATYAGGATGEGCYGKVGVVRLGPLTVRDVPVATGGFKRPVIGTGFLSRFLPTLDYPGRRLVLRSLGEAAPPGVEVPFAVAATHLMLVAGKVAGVATALLVDSGLRDEHGAAFAVPAETLAAAGIPLPELAPETGDSGAGDTTLDLGRFRVPSLALGPLEQRDLVGVYGVFPPRLNRSAGVEIGGLVSHGFLRRYRWTVDFARMRMVFEDPAAQVQR